MEHISKSIGKIMGGLSVRKCNCSMAISVLGDGCPVCQPEFWKEQESLIKSESFLIVRDEWREDIAVGMNHPDKHFSVWHPVSGWEWDMLADYFTIE